MRPYLSLGLPIVLIAIAFWYLLRQYKRVFVDWHRELSVRKVGFYSAVILGKALITLFLIIMIHNNFHNDHRLELLLYINLFFVFAVLQSSYAFGEFKARIQYIYLYAKRFFEERSADATEFRDRILTLFNKSYSYGIRLLIIAAFILVFLPNITVFVAANIFYVFFVLFLVLVAATLNNVIYFGLLALIVYQYDPVSMSIADMNWYVFILAFLILLIGFLVETRLDNRMFFVKTVMSVKSFRFHLGYEIIQETNDYIIYQNLVNGYYYFYFRITGLVIVYDSLVNIKQSVLLQRKMIQKGKQYLRESHEL
jgi:hypothetical protein